MPGSLAAAALALLAAQATPPPGVATAPPPGMVAPDPAAPEDAASLALRSAANRLTVEVRLNGAGPFRFLVDSGATNTVVSRRLATLLSLPAEPDVVLHSVAGESVVPTVRIETLAVGTLAPRAIVAAALDEENLGAAGILGLDVLARGRLTIDFAHARMTVDGGGTARRTPAPIGDEIVVLARRRRGQLVLADAAASGQRVWAVVDTGSMTTIGNPVLRDRLVAKRRAVPQTVPITDVTGRVILGSWAMLPDFRLNAWSLVDVPVAFADAHAFGRFGLSGRPAMLLGMDVMRAFARVSIDFRDRSVVFVRRRAS